MECREKETRTDVWSVTASGQSDWGKSATSQLDVCALFFKICPYWDATIRTVFKPQDGLYCFTSILATPALSVLSCSSTQNKSWWYNHTLPYRISCLSRRLRATCNPSSSIRYRSSSYTGCPQQCIRKARTCYRSGHHSKRNSGTPGVLRMKFKQLL